MLYMLIQLIISALSLIVLDLSTVVFIIIVYFSGIFFLSIPIGNQSKLKSSFKIYQIVYLVGFVYIIFCHIYMVNKDYSYLLAFDIKNYFLPKVEYFLEFNSFIEAQKDNWSNFNVLSRYQAGYFGYLIPFAYLSKFLGANLYISMQFSTLFIASISGVLIHKLMYLNNITNRNAYFYSLLVCIFSIVFFYSTQLLRDIQVMFFYLLGIYLTYEKKLSIINLIKILMVIFFSCTLRVETGLFLFVLIPIYILVCLNESKDKIKILIPALIFTSIIFLFLLVSFEKISIILNNSNEFYFESDKGSGVISTLQSIPFFGNLLAIFYNAIQPLPFWLYFIAPIEDNRPEMYNIMTFPLLFSSLFNWIVIFFLLSVFFIKGIPKKIFSKINKPLMYNMLAGFIFLYIQASVIDQRRLMAYYVIFYIFFFILYENISKSDRYKLLFLSIFTYSILQISIFLIK